VVAYKRGAKRRIGRNINFRKKKRGEKEEALENKQWLSEDRGVSNS